jgi:hypothetical protein
MLPDLLRTEIVTERDAQPHTQCNELLFEISQGTNGAKAVMRERLYRMKHYPVQAQAHVVTRFCEASSTMMEFGGMQRSFRLFWRFTQREWKHSSRNGARRAGCRGSNRNSPGSTR